MVQITGALVLLLTCLALVSSQRKVSRTAQVAEEIKPEINFQCPEEFGYYPHPSDCTLYHVCFFGRPVLESCTGGLMYSPELQTCDWPRNVGCDGTGEVSITSVVSSSNPPSSSSVSSEPRTRYTASAKAPSSSISSQPSVIVTPRGQPRSLHHTQEIVKQQRYYDQDEEIPEQIAVVERQRTYRGQPAKVSDVQRDRDGLSPYGDNSIPSYSSRGEKISVISFGTSQQSNPSYSRVEEASITPQKSPTTATNKAIYNGTRHYESTHYDPYYIYDDVELYRDIEDYPQHYNSNNGGRQHTQSAYRGTPASSVQVLPTSEDVPKRKVVFQEHTYLPQDVYQPTVSEYNDGYVDDQSAYVRQSNRQSTNLRGDRNDINYIEEPSTTKRTTTTIRTTTSTTTTTTTTPRPIPSQKSTVPSRTNTRGRGNLHYSTGGNGDTITVNRGTPPPRTRSTLKPSTSIVSKAAEFVDIYKYPPRRPDPIYPQPVPDKAAAKCRRDVCLLPDCSCGGKEIPGDLPVEQLPQIVLLTFDDSVNDLNKGLYSELFERGRVNPNGCPIAATFYVSHEWTDYSQVQNLYSDGHEIASHTVSHSFGEQFSQKKWTKEVAGQREILSAYGGVKLEDVRGMRAPFLSVGGNKMFKMLYDSNFTYDSSMPIYENKPPSWPYTLDYKLFHDCMIPPCPTRSYPGVWEVPMVMWQDLNGGRCSMGDACSHPADADGVVKLLKKNFQRHYTTNRAPFGLFYHAAYFTKDHHKEGFIKFLDYINSMKDVYLVTNWQAIQWVRDPTPSSRLSTFQPFQCNYSDRPKRCNNPKVCNLWHKSGVRYMRTCQPCPDIYPWTGNTGIRSSRIDNDIED
ncbi:Carbohydrate-binding protein [Oryctes borbonicus]|uniref:Carbohydrate-binding protein n=1 Tax=Oryctes borbonicus TaxID=1629725 RepID=A0A0T6AZ36_9SCAR|nr:Carbohydrate-binding protein [Oryctes borbonicus]